MLTAIHKSYTYIYGKTNHFNPSSCRNDAGKSKSGRWIKGTTKSEFETPADYIPINDMSAESIIGVVEMGCEANENEFRLWREMMQGELFLITDCFIFEFPVNQNLVNMYKLNADDLLRIFPFHKLTLLNGLRDLDDTLKVEMGKQAFLHVTILHDLTLDLTPQVKEIVLDEDGNIKGFKFLLLTCDNMEKRFDFKAKLIFEMNGEKEPMLFNSVFDPSGKNIREQIVFDCSSQLLR